MRAAEGRGWQPAREEAVTAGMGAAKANGRRRAGMGGAQRRTAAGAAEDTAAACLVRVASRPTRIDARIRVGAPKKIWTRVSR